MYACIYLPVSPPQATPVIFTLQPDSPRQVAAEFLLPQRPCGLLQCSSEATAYLVLLIWVL